MTLSKIKGFSTWDFKKTTKGQQNVVVVRISPYECGMSIKELNTITSIIRGYFLKEILGNDLFFALQELI